METIVIKIGGVASDNLTGDFFRQIKEWQAQQKKIVIIHGGGHYITSMMQKMNMTVKIQNGLRVTTPEALEITKMVLIGQVQPMITARFQQNDLIAVGLNASCGHLMQGDFLDQEHLGHVGTLQDVDPEVIQLMMEKQHIPIIAPLAMTEAGEWLNVNADHVACKIAAALSAEELYLLTDVPGVKAGNQWLSELDPAQVEDLIEEEVIKGGMIPKIESAEKALAAGVKKVHITNAIDHEGTILKEYTLEEAAV